MSYNDKTILRTNEGKFFIHVVRLYSGKSRTEDISIKVYKNCVLLNKLFCMYYSDEFLAAYPETLPRLIKMATKSAEDVLKRLAE